jgi:hypothetical protein
MMRTRFGFILCLIMLALTGCVGLAAAAPAGTHAGQTDSTTPYNGQIGPGNSLYGLRIAFENIDESFTFNQSERLEKQINHADLRLTELKQELIDNKTDTAAIALEQYWMKINQTDEALEPLSINGTERMPAINDTGLLHAREMITKHQQVLETLLASHPDNKGLERAYGNSIELEQKFEKRIENARMIQQQTKQNRSFMAQGNQTPLDNQTLQNPGRGNGSDGNMTIPMDWNQSRDKNKFTGNSTRNMDQNLQGINQSGQDPHQQQDNNRSNTGNTQNDNTNRNTGSMNGGNNNGNTKNSGR